MVNETPQDQKVGAAQAYQNLQEMRISIFKDTSPELSESIAKATKEPDQPQPFTV